MELAIEVSSLGREARSASGIKLRQPLARATVVADETTLKKLRGFKDIIAAETLSAALRHESPPEGTRRATFDLDGELLSIGLILHKSFTV